jgi:hypothetical protein
VRPKPPVPLWRWVLWWATLGLGLLIFYVLLTPIWIGLRALAWLAELRARRARALGAR